MLYLILIIFTTEKMQMVKQKGNYNCKRGDKRNFKVPMKAKYDSFTMKAGLASCPATRGNNFFGNDMKCRKHFF